MHFKSHDVGVPNDITDCNNPGISSADASEEQSAQTVVIDWAKPPMSRFRDGIQPAAGDHSIGVRPIRAERRAGLIRAIAFNPRWLDEIVAGAT